MTGSKFEPVAARRTGIFTGAAMALALLAAPLAAPAADGPAKGLEANKKAAVAFYEAAINRKDYAAAVAYLGPQYKQHNPTAADGAEGLKGFIEFLKAKFPNQKGEIKTVIAEGDKVVIRPMMYLALSYDHRIIDGREAVLFLVAIKELIEDPTRFILRV